MQISVNTLFDREDVLSSLSKSGELSSLETLIPVQLDSENFEQFRKHFHPPRATHAPKMYVELARHLAELSAYVNSIFDGLRIGLGSGSYWAASGRDVGAEISSIIEKTYKNAGEQDAATKKYIAQMASGAHHIIRPSERFKGGKDVMFVGHRGPTKTPLLNVEARDNSLLPLFKNGYKYQELAEGPDAVFNTKLGRAIIETGKALQRVMFGQDVSLKTSYSRLYFQHRVSALALADEFRTVFTSGPLAKAGIAVQLPEFNSTLAGPTADFLRAYNSLLLVREPTQTIVNTRARMDQSVPDETMEICLEAQILQPEVCFSFAANLPEPFVAYITQAKDGAQPSLAALNTWALTWASSMLRPPGVRTGALYPNRVPMYVLMPSASMDLVKRRKELGLYSEPGRVNEDGLYIADNGDLAFLPQQDELVVENSKQYEALVEKALALSFEAGTPLASGQSGSTGSVFDLASPSYKDGISALKKELTKYCGSMQTYNWDLNTVLTVSAGDPDRLVSTRLIGANKPDELNLATYMRLPFGQGMRDMFSRTTLAGSQTAASVGDFAQVGRAEHLSVFKNFAELYNQLSILGKVPNFESLVKKAAAALKIKSLEDEHVAPFELNRFNPRETIYKYLIKPDLSLDQNVETNAGDYVLACLQYAANDASGSGRSNLAADAIKQGIDILDHYRYFNGEVHTLGEFSRLYSYLGGQIFYQAAHAMLSVPRADLMKFQADLVDGMKQVRFLNIVSQVMPVCVMLGKYVPEKRDAIYAKADEIAENNKHPKVSEDQLNIAGCKTPRDGKPGMQLFPHQAESLSILKNHPKIAVLDIAPGGGKCLVGSSLVPTSAGLLSLEELWGMSDRSENVRGFQRLNVSVVSHARRRELTDFAYKSSGKTRRVVLSDGDVAHGLPEHKLWALRAGDLNCDFVRLDELGKTHWLPKAIGDGIFPSKTPVVSHGAIKMRLTEDLAEILGWLVAEGYVPEDYECARFEQHDKDMMNRYLSIANAVFGAGAAHLRNTVSTSAQFASVEVRQFVRSLMTCGTSAFKQVPLCIRTAPRIYQVAFLRALFEGDGSVYHANKGKGARRVWVVEYSSISQTLVRQVKMMLENMGVACSIKIGKSYLSNGHAHKKRVHTLYVNWRHIPDFKEQVGFISDRKCELLAQAAAHTEWASYEAAQCTNIEAGGWANRIPALAQAQWLLARVLEALSKFEYDVPKNGNGSGGRTETWSIKKLLRDTGMGRNSKPAVYDNGATNRYSIRRIFRMIDALPREIRTKLYDMPKVREVRAALEAMLKCVWVCVESSRKAGVEDVYDLSVPGPHSYSVGGIYGHNTTIGICDIAMLYADGLIKRPFIFCPNGLVKNWVEDLHKFMEGRWNIIPITTETYATWGDERLTELISKAPRNTIVVVGNSFLSNRGKVQLVLGNSVEPMSDSAEFCKKFEPDYVIIDESHRIKNPRSAIHRGIKTINQMSSVKYGRIATGTLIQNVLSDVVGQSAIYNGQIFRSKDEFEEAHKGEIVSIGGKRVLDYLPDAPLRARRRFSEFATVLTYKRKEWAFMLPLPIETFISVRFEDVDDEDTGRQHRMFYDAVLKQTMEELKNDRKIQKLLKGGKDDGDDDDDDDNGEETVSSKITTKDGTSIDVAEGDDDSDSLDNLEGALQPYLQRLERILTDPFGDEELLPVAKEFFSNVDRDSFVTAKVRKIIERIKLQFTERPWQKGMAVSSSDIVDFNGRSYIYRSHEPKGQTRANAHINPADDTENWKPQVRGKVLVFCRYTRSVDAIYRALPADLQKQAVIFHGEAGGNKWENLDRFKSDPKVKILIANEMGISEGHNLQMATRFIRAEAPWAPGELDQSASRIFRPDVGGEYERQTIFMDWVLCDSTLEVAKMGRLISKMLRKAQFDELDNASYYKDLNPLNLPIIKMSLDNIRDLNKMSDLCAIGGEGDTGEPHEHSYIGQYQYLVHEMASEFREMRKTKRAYMVDVTPTPMPEDAKILEFTPWVPNMKVPDRHDEGLISLTELLQEEAHPLVVAFKKNSKALVGQIVRTEFGLGTIRRVTTKRKGAEDGNLISKVFVDLAQGGSVDNLSASKIYLATKLTEKASHKYDKVAPKITDGDKKRTARYRKQADEAEQRDGERARKRAEGVSERVRRPKPVIEEPVVDEDSLDISLYPVVYNQFLALEAVPADNEFDTLKKYGFRKFGNYAWLGVKTLKNFEAIWDFLDEKFTLVPKTVRLLESLLDSFQTGRGRKFAVELSPVGELPMFYRTRHQMTVVKNKRRPELKLYPIIINESLVLVVDIATNPVIRKYLGRAIPGTSPSVKFEEADGLDIMFFSNKSELVAKVRELRKAGFNVTNIDELKREVKELNLKQLAGK